MGDGASLLLALFLTASFFLVSASPSTHLRAFHPLRYDTEETERRHARVRRSVPGGVSPLLPASGVHTASLSIGFEHPDRPFELELVRDESSAFAADHTVELNGKELPGHQASSHLQYMVQGHVKDDPDSYVYGSVRDGIFDGTIKLGDGTIYHAEKATKYYGAKAADKDFHSILYRDSDIKMREMMERGRSKRSPSGVHYNAHLNEPSRVGCPLDGAVRQQMEDVQNAAVHLAEEEEREVEDADWEHPADKYLPREKRQSRAEKESINGYQIYKVRTCSLYMQADQKLWDHVFQKEGQQDPTRTREEILQLFDNHLKAVNHIYQETSFSGVNGINFVIQRTSIYDAKSCTGSPTAADQDGKNPFCEERVDVSNYLNLNSKRNHSQFCLAYSITYRDFIGGTLGLAWVASPAASTAGGICEIYKMYSERSGRVWRSLNTGIITLVNYGNRVPPRVSQLTLAHEIGHNFGSPHDWPSQCQPGLPEGNFIMFASATSGDKDNNAKFSPCSTANISNVLFSVLKERPVDPQRHLYSPTGGKRNCFSESTTAFCGNQIKEDGEECDCGFNLEDCARMQDTCCYPHRSADRSGSLGCRRKPGKECSPSEGVCCGSDCRFKGRGGSVKCSEEGECVEEQYCNAIGAGCPDPRPKANGTLCQDNTKVCNLGNCNKSICAHVGLAECFVTKGTDEDKCELACLVGGKCLRSFEIRALSPFYQLQKAGKGIMLRPGSPCNNYQGYCDIFLKCRSVDSNGPLSRLKNLLFNEKTLQTVAEWVQEHWWAVVLMGIGLVLFMALFIKCCAVHTPSTNPRKPQAHSIYETLRHPGTLVRSRPPGDRRSRDRSRDPRHRRGQPAPEDPAGHRRRRSRSRQGPAADIPLNGIPAQPAGPSVAVMVPVEPPPPYTAAAAMPNGPPPQGGPPRGHRKSRPTNAKPTTRR